MLRVKGGIVRETYISCDLGKYNNQILWTTIVSHGLQDRDFLAQEHSEKQLSSPVSLTLRSLVEDLETSFVREQKVGLVLCRALSVLCQNFMHFFLFVSQIEELLLAFVDITVFVSCPKTKDIEELKTYFKVTSFPSKALAQFIVEMFSFVAWILITCY